MNRNFAYFISGLRGYFEDELGYHVIVDLSHIDFEPWFVGEDASEWTLNRKRREQRLVTIPISGADNYSELSKYAAALAAADGEPWDANDINWIVRGLRSLIDASLLPRLSSDGSKEAGEP